MLLIYMLMYIYIYMLNVIIYINFMSKIVWAETRDDVFTMCLGGASE